MSALGTSHISQTLLWLHLTKRKSLRVKEKNSQMLSKFHIISSEFCIGTSFNVPKIAAPKGEWEQSPSADSSTVLGARLAELRRLMHTKPNGGRDGQMFMLCVSEVERVKIKACLLCILSAEDWSEARGCVCITCRSHFKAKLERDERERQGALSCDEWLLDITQPWR